MGYLSNFWGAVLGNTVGGRAEAQAWTGANRYSKKRAYYDKVDLFENLGRGLKELSSGQIVSQVKGLRNPARRVVEFYAAHICPGDLPEALPVETSSANKRIEPAIEQIFTWSNWAAKKQVAVRWDARDGDLFMQAAKPEGKEKSFINLPDAAHVTELEKDDNDFIVRIRLDIPRVRRSQNETTEEPERYVRTEIWDKSRGDVRVWEHPGTNGIADLKQLASYPVKRKLLSEESPSGSEDEFIGANFIPFVHVKFSDEGGLWGVGAYESEIPTIDELCKMVTRLHGMFFRYDEPLDVVESSLVGPDNQPLPPPRFEDQRVSGVASGLVSLTNQDERDTVEIAGRTRVLMPSGWTLKANSSAVKYAEGLSLVTATIEDELEPSLPELAYDRLRKKGGELSGRAIQLHLSDAEAKGIEARGHFEAGLIRVTQMCMTLAQVHGLDGFSQEQIGTFDAGDFDFSFEKRDLIPIPESEKLELEKAKLEVEEARKRLSQPEPETAPPEFSAKTRALFDSLGNGTTPSEAE